MNYQDTHDSQGRELNPDQGKQAPQQEAPAVDRALKVASDVSAGAGDALSVGMTMFFRKAMNYDSVVDKSSLGYWAGVTFGTVVSVPIGSYIVSTPGKVTGLAGWLNRGDWLRIGYGYDEVGQQTFRLALGNRRNDLGLHAHLDLSPKPAIQAVKDFGTQLLASFSRFINNLPPPW